MLRGLWWVLHRCLSSRIGTTTGRRYLLLLREGLIAQGAVVWAAVSDEAVDTDVQFESLAEKVPVERLQHGVVGDGACVAAVPATLTFSIARWRGG